MSYTYRQTTEYNPIEWARNEHTKCSTKDILQGKPCKTFSRPYCLMSISDPMYSKITEGKMNGDYSDWQQTWGSGDRKSALLDFKNGYEAMIDDGYCGLVKVIVKEEDQGLDRPEWIIWALKNVISDEAILPTKFPTNKEL